jgi:hypothetical protein
MNLKCKIISNANLFIFIIHVALDFSENIIKIMDEFYEKGAFIVDF